MGSPTDTVKCRGCNGRGFTIGAPVKEGVLSHLRTWTMRRPVPRGDIIDQPVTQCRYCLGTGVLFRGTAESIWGRDA